MIPIKILISTLERFEQKRLELNELYISLEKEEFVNDTPEIQEKLFKVAMLIFRINTKVYPKINDGVEAAHDFLERLKEYKL